MFMRLRLWLEDPHGTPPGEYRFYYMTNVAYFFGLVMHVLFLGLFVAAGSWILAAYNLASIAAFGGCLVLNRAGRPNPATYLAWAEITVHAALATLFIGWSTGFHYYMLITAPLFFLSVTMPRPMRFLLALATLAIYAALYFWSLGHAPRYPLPPDVTTAFHLWNIAGVIIGFGFIGFYYGAVTRRAESSLLAERARLRDRNDKMEKELALARRIQLQLIPSSSPADNVSFWYKPMDMVGGDFYDFVQLQDPERLGIFISDVSGHGVPAALVTSMIKSLLLQAGHLLESPAALLAYMNRVLLTQTSDNFVTAFYGIHDRARDELVFASAGHNAPYMIGSGKVEMLECPSKSVPLAILGDEELLAVGKEYKECTRTVVRGTKMLLYTDGLTEAVNRLEGSEEFGERSMRTVLLDTRTRTAAELVKAVSDSLITFRGSESFDDDVCLVCLEF